MKRDSFWESPKCGGVKLGLGGLFEKANPIILVIEPETRIGRKSKANSSGDHLVPGKSEARNTKQRQSGQNRAKVKTQNKPNFSVFRPETRIEWKSKANFRPEAGDRRLEEFFSSFRAS